MKNCVNCGAPLKKGEETCEYCGTSYEPHEVNAVIEFDPSVITSVLTPNELRELYRQIELHKYIIRGII